VAVTGPDLDDASGEAEFDDEFGGDKPSEEPWHNSTRAVVGASAAGVAVLAVLVAAVMFMTGGDESQSPADFVDPSFTETAAGSASSATTTTPTITSTPKISTTEINGPPPPPTNPGSSDTSTSGSETSSSPAVIRPPRQREADADQDGPTSRRPRFNITRTLGPGPLG
jgi:hypothetical protein